MLCNVRPVGRSNTVFTANFGSQNNCKASYDAGTDKLTVQLVNCPELTGDIRVLFQTSSRQATDNSNIELLGLGMMCMCLCTRGNILWAHCAQHSHY